MDDLEGVFIGRSLNFRLSKGNNVFFITLAVPPAGALCPVLAPYPRRPQLTHGTDGYINRDVRITRLKRVKLFKNSVKQLEVFGAISNEHSSSELRVIRTPIGGRFKFSPPYHAYLT